MAPHLEDIFMGPQASPSLTDGYRWEPSPRRVRVVFGGETIADSLRVMLLHEFGRLPVFYFPREEVRPDTLERTDHATHSELKGDATYWTVRAGDRTAENAAWSYENPPAGSPDVGGYVAFYWSEMDAWYEEEERAFAHARDPYKLVDVRQSARPVRVELGGVTVAETQRPKLIFETGLPVRYYFPREDVRMDLLEPSATTTQCAYKGETSHWSGRIGDRKYEDVAWTYRAPLALVAPVTDLIAFYQERVDAVYVDGERIEKPRTPWAR